MSIEEEQVTVEGVEVEQTPEAKDDTKSTTIANSDVVVKYKKAAAWANEAITAVIAATKVDAKVGDLCKLGDETTKKIVTSMFKGIDKGIGFPTCVSVNNQVCHNSPEEKDDAEAYNVTIKLNDIVHIDLGVHVDGFCAQVAHTIQVTANNELAPDTKETNVISAAYEAIQTAIRGFRPENTLYDVTEMIEGVAKVYDVVPVEGVLSHQTKQFIVDGSKCIPSKNLPDQKVHNYQFEPPQVWTLDVAFSTGTGKLKEKESKTAVFKMALDPPKSSSRIQAAEEVRKEADSVASTFPFAVRNLSHKRARLGLSELVRHNVIIPYPVLYEKADTVVAHFKITLFVTEKKIERLTGLPVQKGAKKLPLDSNDELLASSKAPMSFAKKKKAEDK